MARKNSRSASDFPLLGPPGYNDDADTRRRRRSEGVLRRAEVHPRAVMVFVAMVSPLLPAALADSVAASWRRGEPPDLRELLDGLCRDDASRQNRRQLACELIKLDLNHFWCRNDSAGMAAETSSLALARPRRLEANLTKFPDVDQDDEAVLSLIEHEFRVRHNAGQAPDPSEYAARFPRLAQASAERLGTLAREFELEWSIHDAFAALDPFLEGSESTVVLTGQSRSNDAATNLEACSDDWLSEQLREIRPFSELSRHVRDAIRAKLAVRHFQSGDVLLRQGDVADSLLVVLEGAVEVIMEDQGQMHAIARLGRHTVIGEIGLVTKEVRSAHVIADSAGCAALIAKDDFEHIAGRYPRLSIALSELIAERVGMQTIDVLCGKTIEGYTIRRRLGRGAMGIVYSAVEVTTGRPLALKMLRHDLVFDRFANERFHQEAEIVQSLDHVHIIRVFREFCAFGTSFIAMELCDGPSLRDVLNESGALSLSDARRLLGQLAAGLAHAHGAGVAHRDLKPSNVIVGQDGIAKLADFGLARRLATDQVNLTSIGQILGTPRYMAPEQLEGDRGDARSDLFSFGCLAYELLAGQPLFRAVRFRELLQERREWSMPPPEAMQFSVDEGLRNLLCRCLAPDPEERQVELSELAEWAGPILWRPKPSRPADRIRTADAESLGTESLGS